jgi:DNA-binding transcriptional LysR family regulator
MQSMSWDDLRYCLAVASEGSLTAAARKLEVNHTTVSRRITALERELNAPLFDRSTTGWLLTPVGETIVKSAEQMAEEVHSIRRLVQADRQELSGKLRITAVDICIQRLLLPGIKAFSALYPDISIELIASEYSLDLAVHEADIAFRTTNEPPPNVVGKKIAEFANAIYSTPELYLQYRRHPESVGAISWQGDGHTLPEWLPQGFGGMAVRYRANSLNVVYDMTRNGMGFSMLPCALGDLEPALQRIPCQISKPRMGLWVLSHIDLRTTARIRIFRDFMIDWILPYVPLIEGEREQAHRDEKYASPWSTSAP